MANTSANRLKVNKLYNTLLGRDASFGAGSEFDADYWLGKSDAEIESGIKSGSEFLNRKELIDSCLLYTSPSPRDGLLSRMPSSA